MKADMGWISREDALKFLLRKSFGEDWEKGEE